MARAPAVARAASGRSPAIRFRTRPREFFAAMARALSLGLAWQIAIEAPLASMHKADVIRLGPALGVPFELTLSCMQPDGRAALRPLQQVPRAAGRVPGGGDRGSDASIANAGR